MHFTMGRPKKTKKGKYYECQALKHDGSKCGTPFRAGKDRQYACSDLCRARHNRILAKKKRLKRERRRRKF